MTARRRVFGIARWRIFGIARRCGSMIARLREWAGHIRRDALALALAARDPRVPWVARLLALLLAIYALSPIDLIPDFIPVLGLLDEAILLPLGMLLAIRLIPAPVMEALRARAARMRRFASLAGACLVIGVWLACLLLAAWLLSWV